MIKFLTINLWFMNGLGKILLDGHDLKNIQLKWLREQMGLVSQEPALFATTIALNILYGKEGANMDQIIEAAKSANVHSFIQGLPDGYQTQAGYLLSSHSQVGNKIFKCWISSCRIVATKSSK